MTNCGLQANASPPPVFLWPEAKNCFFIFKWLKKNKEISKGFEIVKVGAGEEMIKQTAGVRNREEEGTDMRTPGLPHWRLNYPLINTAGGRWLMSGWW